jgi:hypothetical protein
MAGVFVLLAVAAGVAGLFFLWPRGKGVAHPKLAADDFFGGRSQLDGIGSGVSPRSAGRGQGFGALALLVLIGVGAAFSQYSAMQQAGAPASAVDTTASTDTSAAPAADTSMSADTSAPATPIEPGPLPDGFDLAQARLLLNGSSTTLDSAFQSQNTTQGADFWARETQTLSGGGQLSDPAKAVVGAWMQAAQVEAGSVPSNFHADWAAAALQGRSDAVNQAFTWGETSQGSAFWSTENSTVNGGGQLSPKAARIIRTWIALSSSASH